MAGPEFALMLLADGRFPAGGHAHSGGVESAVADGRVTDEASLAAFVLGRLETVGLGDAALVAATVGRLRAAEETGQDSLRAAVLHLDAEATARTPALPLRTASRRQGRQLFRAAARCWPRKGGVLPIVGVVLPDGPMLPVATGAVATAAGLDAADAARLVLHHTLSTPAQAAVKLLGLDPFAVTALCADLAAAAEAVLAKAMLAAAGPLEELPARSGPILDIAALEHRGWDVRMFAT